YARRMKQMHYDLYTKVSRETFLGEIEALKKAIPTLTDDQARARLRRITAMVGDGHTSSALLPEGTTKAPRLPLHLYQFKEGLYIIGADKEHADLVGARVLKVGPLDADAALAAVRPYISVDNDMGYRVAGPPSVCNPILLREIGAMSGTAGVELT